MESEYTRRKHVVRLENDIAEFSKTIVDQEDTIRMLRDELRHRRIMHTTQRKIIEALQNTMVQNGLPMKRTMASLSNCKAADDEICPLSLMPINQSLIPFCGDSADKDILVVNPLKPEHKCAELACGHRFNSMWLIYHFVQNGTFRCPVCRAGPDEFRFQRDELPPSVVKMLKMVEEFKAAGKRK